MGRTLLIGGPRATWRDLRKSNPSSPWLCLDPADPNNGLLGRLVLKLADRSIWRFYGSLDPMRSPHVLVATAAELLRAMPDDGFVQLFSVRSGPLVREVAQLIARLAEPDRICVADGLGLDLEGWPVGPERVETPEPFPPVVVLAQRKALWLELLDRCEDHEVLLGSVAIQGARLGSGEPVDRVSLAGCGIDALWAERSAGTLFAVVPQSPGEGATSRAMDVFECRRVVYAEPKAYDGLLCAFGRQDGEDFGMGMIESVDFEAGIVRAKTTAVAPAPVRILKIGGLRLGKQATELGEARPWQV